MCNLYLFLIIFIVTLNALGSIKGIITTTRIMADVFRLLINKKGTRGAKKQKVFIGRTTTLDVLHPRGGGGGEGNTELN